MKFRYPVNYVAITQKFKKEGHFGMDLGWNSQHGGKNQPIYAAQDGEVVAVKDHDYTTKSWGNYVKIYHGENVYTLYGHMKEGVLVKKGQKVKTGEILGYMGNTGHSFGEHVHYEIYKGGASTSYRIDPQPLTYVYEGQVVSDGSKDNVLYYKEETSKEESKETNVIDYTVKKGDTLSEIAVEFNTTVAEISKLNPEIKDLDLIYAEQVIKVPTLKTEEVYYAIKKGDTLSGIAKKYDTSVDELVKLNDIKDPDKIYAGDKIRVK